MIVHKGGGGLYRETGPIFLGMSYKGKAPTLTECPTLTLKFPAIKMRNVLLHFQKSNFETNKEKSSPSLDFNKWENSFPKLSNQSDKILSFFRLILNNNIPKILV